MYNQMYNFTNTSNKKIKQLLVCKTIYSIVNVKVEKKYKCKFIPDFFVHLPTFDRTLKFNSHIHIIIAKNLINKNKNFKKCKYFNYDTLSKQFMKILLDKMESQFILELLI